MNKEQIKSNFRVVETDKFYIQEKSSIFGWTYDINGWEINASDISDYPWWFNLLMFIMIFSFSGVIISGIASFFELKALIAVAICIIIMFSSFLLKEYICSKEKNFSFNYTDIRNAEKKIDELVQNRIKEKEIEEKKKIKKYHYFYSQKQLRKEKLNKISKM